MTAIRLADGHQLIDTADRRRWLASREGRRRWAQWSRTQPALLGWSTLDLLSPVGSARTDSMQAALVSVAQRGDGEAALLLLAQLRPGLTRICRWATASGWWPPPDSVQEVRAAFFETLCRHSLDRRPNKIAANLVLDTRQRVQRSQLAPPNLDSLDDQSTSRGFDPTGDLADNLAVLSTVRSAIAGMPGSVASRRLTADLAYRVWFLDEPRAAVAADLGIGDQTIAVRLHRLRSVIDRTQLQN
ncbi:MAG: hypothetical protein ACRBK7_16875 [Acidimicrobiales bacterium]